MQSKIMYIENKSDGDGLTGPSRIGRVSFSKTGKTIYYKGAELQSLKGYGYKANYYDVNTGDRYWISGPKKNGQDTLYPDHVEIDEDVGEEYWREIRGFSESKGQSTFRSEGKHAGWRAAQFLKKKKV
jgi:hypothetical protein